MSKGMDFWRVFLFSWGIMMMSAPLNADVACIEGGRNPLPHLFKKVIRLGGLLEKGRSQDVLRRLPELHEGVRHEFEKYILELRAYEPEILGLPVYERVYFEYLRSGLDPETAKQTQIFIEDFSDVFDFSVKATTRVDPANPDIIYAKIDAMKYFIEEGGRIDDLRKNALALKAQLLKRIDEIKGKGWVTYEEYISLGAEAAFLSTLGMKYEHLEEFVARETGMGRPTSLTELLMRRGKELAFFSKIGFEGYMKSRLRTDYHSTIFDSDKAIFPGNVFVFTVAGKEKHISAEKIVVPGTHIFLGELVSNLQEDNGLVRYPDFHAAHDVFHARNAKDIYAGLLPQERRKSFQSWTNFRSFFVNQRKKDPEVYKLLIEASSYRSFHEELGRPESFNRLYFNLKNNHENVKDRKERKLYERAISFLLKQVPVEKFQEESFFYAHRCGQRCRDIPSVQKLSQLLTDTKSLNKFSETVRELDADIKSLSAAVIDTRYTMGPFDPSFYKLDFLIPVLKKFKDQPVTWGNLEDIATGKIKIDGYRLPEQLALSNFLSEMGYEIPDQF